MDRLDRLDVISRKVFAGKLPGERRSKRRGQSVEFDDFRLYSPGDDLRHIDWNVYARLERLFVKLFRAEEDLSVVVAVDASASMQGGPPSKLVLAQRLAMSLAYLALVNRNRVVLGGLGLAGRPAWHRLSPMRGRQAVSRAARFVLDELTSEPGSGRPSLTAGLRALAQSRTGRGVVIVISDFLTDEDLRDGLNWLAAGRGFDTWCVQVLSPGEMDPLQLRDAGLIGDLRLLDVETGEAAEVTVSPALIRRYRRRLTAFCEQLRAACLARGMAYLLVPSDTDLEALLLEQLRRRGLIG